MSHAHIHPFSNVGAFGYIIPLSVELQKCRWLLQISGYYLNHSTSVEPRGPLYQSGRLDWDSGLLDVALGYRVIDRQPFSLDFLAGGRYQHVGLDFLATAQQRPFGSPIGFRLQRLGRSIYPSRR